jgi:hypothetical protein
MPERAEIEGEVWTCLCGHITKADRCEDCGRARPPQSENHEAPEFDEQAITDILVAIDDTLWGCGRERMDIIDGPTVDALRDAVKRELVAFVARAGESNEGGNQNDERRH